MIDALGHRIVVENRFLADIAPDPAPVRTVFGFSSSAIPSVLTGRLPQEHGHFAMYLRDPERSPFRRHRWLIRVVGEWLGREGFLKRRLTAALRRAGITGYFSLYELPPRLMTQWDLCQRRNLFEPGALDGHETVFDRLRRAGIPHRVWDWRAPEEDAWAELEEAVRRGQPPFLFFYGSRLDGVMHATGTRSPETREALRRLEARILGLLRVRPGLRLFVFGDHGMTDVAAAHDLWSRLPTARPGGVLYFLDSTMARFWFDDPGQRDAVARLLESLDYGHVLSQEEERQLGIHFPDHRYGEAIFLLDPGHILVPSFMGRSPVAGMHGYHPDHPDSDTTLLTNTEIRPPETILGLAGILEGEVRRLEEGGR
jgi:predicted AlkP superfamily pyrophosphatase or phosphodiesterase